MTDEIDVSGLVHRFVRLLVAFWDEVVPVPITSPTDAHVNDWVQANWEMLVEGGLPPGMILEPYGDGADCNGSSSRVYRPDASPTHTIVCRPKSRDGMILDLFAGRTVSVDRSGVALEEFVTLAGRWYARSPPFDCVLVEGASGPQVFRLDDVDFVLARI